VSGYVLDNLALIAGLAGIGDEHHRRELSRLVHGAIDGGPRLDVPAICLTAATLQRAALADHFAEIVAAAPPDAISVSGLSRSGAMDAVRATRRMGWPATHAVIRALVAHLPILTVDPERYRGVAVDVLSR